MQLFRALIALTVLGASAATLAEETPSRALLPASLMFSIDDSDLGIFQIARDDTQVAAVSYLTNDGIVQLLLGNPLARQYSDPLFCFDFSVGANVVSLEAHDINGHLILGDIRLRSALSYILSNNELSFSPGSETQCFYYGTTSGEFGLFGRPPLAAAQKPGGQIFADRFEGNEQISIEYVNLPSFRNPGSALNYTIILSNEGNVDLNQVAFQEVFPRASDYYDATLNSGTWNCSDGGTGLCPTASEDPNSLRFGNLSLPVGASISFNVSRIVQTDAIIGASIDLHAGVVAGSGNLAAFDAVKENVVVIGTANSVFASPAQAMAGQPAAIEVTVLDSSLNPVPLVTVDLIDPDGMSITPTSAQTSDDEDSFALFHATATQAGTYYPEFQAGSTGMTSAAVTILAADPATISAEASVNQATADGVDEVAFVVLVEDQYANPVPATLVEVDNDGGLGDIEPSALTDSNGLATFTATSETAGSYTVTFKLPDGPVTDSASVDFVAGPPAQIVFFVQPSNTAVLEAISPPVVVRVLDTQGNHVVLDNDTNVVLRLRNNGVIINPLIGFEVASSGEAIFSDLIISSPGTDYDLQAVADGPGGFTTQEFSDPFAVTP